MVAAAGCLPPSPLDDAGTPRCEGNFFAGGQEALVCWASQSMCRTAGVHLYLNFGELSQENARPDSTDGVRRLWKMGATWPAQLASCHPTSLAAPSHAPAPLLHGPVTPRSSRSPPPLPGHAMVPVLSCK